MSKKIFLIILGILICLFIAGIIAIKVIYKEPKVAVICYHNVATEEEIANAPEEKLWTISVDNFEKQMKFLHDFKFKTLTLDEFYKWKKGELEVPFNSVLVTFDDGYLSNYEYAYPILKKYNINATAFLIGKNLKNKTSDEWSGCLNTYMGRDLVKKAKEEYPNLEFASHTYNMHIVDKLKGMKKDDIEEDFNNMKEVKNVDTENAIEENTSNEDMNTQNDTNENMNNDNFNAENVNNGSEENQASENNSGNIKNGEQKNPTKVKKRKLRTLEYVAYPFGLTNDDFIEVLKENNVKLAFVLSDNRKATRGDDDYRVNRINTSTDKPLYKFALRFLLPY